MVIFGHGGRLQKMLIRLQNVHIYSIYAVLYNGVRSTREGMILMQYVIETLKSGIIRICLKPENAVNFLERYGLVKIPSAGYAPGVKTENGKITLPNGRELNFFVRGSDDDFWQSENDYMLELFKDKVPDSINIEGRPKEYSQTKPRETNSDLKFGISFGINENERFYGLGEASRSKIELRGASYQNWAVYQFDEIAIPLVMSDDNWGLFINAQDRHFVDIDDFAKGRITVLGNNDYLDVFILYGESMKDILKLYTEITGENILLPKWKYGLSYVAPLHADQFELLNQAMKFKEKHIPCDSFGLEPGWMNKFYDYSFDKDWNLEKFHIDTWMRSRDVQYSFLSVMRRYGFHVTLWLCVHYDFCDHEERLACGKGMLTPWYEHLKKFVDAGADGFKLDPADMLMRADNDCIYTNGKSESEMHNITQAILAKQVYNGLAEQTNKRPFLEYSGGYTGQQRWSAATTGDNGGLEGSMIWLESLAMSGFMNTTVDMDVYDIAAIHYAMLAPWAHHNAWSGCRQPWYAGDENEKAYTYYARLRYKIIPYLYSAAIEGYKTAVPIIRPMALEFQSDKEAADFTHQYMLGESILISAFTNELYLPHGEWIDFWTGEKYSGPLHIEYTPPQNRGGAMFIKNGAIIPQWRERDYTSQYSEERIELHIYPYKKSSYIFYEDDGISLEYLNGAVCETLIECNTFRDCVKIHIGSRIGEYKNKPGKRIWEITVHGTTKKAEVICDESSAEITINYEEI